jgi:hypothetical protein
LEPRPGTFLGDSPLFKLLLKSFRIQVSFKLPLSLRLRLFCQSFQSRSLAVPFPPDRVAVCFPLRSGFPLAPACRPWSSVASPLGFAVQTPFHFGPLGFTLSGPGFLPASVLRHQRLFRPGISARFRPETGERGITWL